MKIVIDREQFMSAFSLAATVAPSRCPAEACMSIKLDCNGATRLYASDLEQFVRIDVPGVDIDRQGQALLPVAMFAGVLREASDEKLLLSLDDKGGLTIKGARFQHNIKTASPDDFPAFTDSDKGESVTLPARALRAGLQRTAFAASTEGSRYSITSVLFDLSGGLTLVGTDGSAMAAAPLLEGKGKDAYIVSLRSSSMLSRLLDCDGDVELTLAANAIRVAVDGMTFNGRLVEGRFPRWRDVFPARQRVSVEVSVGPLASAVRQAALASDNSESFSMNFAIGDGELKLKLTGQNANSEVALPVGPGESTSFNVNYRYVLDMLKTFPPEHSLTLSADGPGSGVVFSDAAGYRYIVMPLSEDRK